MTTDFQLNQLAINTIRCLAMDAVQQANSGHPGMPMGMAPAAYLLWTRHLKHNPANPQWADRDRFVLSAGHGSMLLYSLLYLSGYGLELEDLKQFRQWGSSTPGHPEYGHTAGVELTTGPLGQGISSAVGLAIAEAHLAARFNRQDYPVVDHHTWVIAGDGCLQEGISSEACSLAGHLGLGKLNVIYDDNSITIDGDTSLSFTEDVAKRYEAYGWQVITVEGDGNDLEAIDQAIIEAKGEQSRPTLIKLRSHIGYGSPNMQDTHTAHGSPLGHEEIRLTKQNLGWPSEDPFHVPDEVLSHYRSIVGKGAREEQSWNALISDYSSRYPELSNAYQNHLRDRHPMPASDLLPAFEAGNMIATRSASGEVLNSLMPELTNILGGSADLTPSNNTWFKGAEDFQPGNYGGRYIRYGVREHAMGAILNGINVHGQLRAYGGTFMVFADYLRPAMRVAALSGYPSIYVFTHDSIGVGEDGPTHQPVETLASLRAMIGLRVFRPADANETAQAWRFILEHKDRPACLLLSRQNLEVFDEKKSYMNTERGAYAVKPCPNPDVLLLASGSELGLVMRAAAELAKQDIAAQVVSMPCWELFEDQDEDYRESVLPADISARVGVEAGIEQGWQKYLGDKGQFVGMSSYGASAPANTCFEKFGITVDAVVAAALTSIEETKS